MDLSHLDEETLCVKQKIHNGQFFKTWGIPPGGED
jgi:hypothetical protein